ncbi:MAG: signal peptidase I [Halapricum sp.]
MGVDLLDRFDWTHAATYLAIALFVLVLGVFVVAAVPQVVGADHSYVVESGSMSPTFGPGSVVFVSSSQPAQIQKGDVITFRDHGPDSQSRRVTHRVVTVVRENGTRQFRTQGDANEDPDPRLVQPDEVVGVEQFSIPLVGYGLSLARSPLGVVALIVVPAILLAVSELWSLYRDATDDESTEAE